ncbi:MAG TPA: malto-oligosyltrehalose trehalohydrolase [Anaeromyxobacteraceae bacterium]|nr:malto-oligosyltrehalose trehalohydrolase [Anaeromyxobacteraceae bacterium]
MPEIRRHGPRLTPRGVAFSVWAPLHERLSVRLAHREVPMEVQEGGWFYAEVAGEGAGTRYGFVLPDGRALPDPASRRQPEGVHAASEVFDASRYRWIHPFDGIRRDALVFYEVHVGTFADRGTFAAAAQRLPDLADLGVTCVELLPVQPFPGHRNWGYDGVFPYAVHEAYGGPEELQRFVDRAHGLGLAVCLDVVYNHLGPEGNYLPAFGSWFTDRHQTPWGDGLDLDGASSAAVRSFLVGAAEQWVRDFRVDVLRLDAVHAIQDDSARHLVGAICDAVGAVARETGRRIHVVAESDLEDRKVVDPPPGGWGCSAMWSDDFHHALHAMLTGERDAFLVDFGAPEHLARTLREGFRFQGEPSAYRKKPWGTSTGGLVPAQFVVGSQNHDQVGNRPHGERLAQLAPPEALPAIAAITCLAPGLPLLFMGEEYGELRPFQYFTSHGDRALAKAVTEGRRAEFIASAGGEEVPDPQDPATFDRSRLSHRRDGWHAELRGVYRELLHTRARHAEIIGSRWPEVRREGRAFQLAWPGALTLEVNLGPEPALGLGGWVWWVREGASAR